MKLAYAVWSSIPWPLQGPVGWMYHDVPIAFFSRPMNRLFFRKYPQTIAQTMALYSTLWLFNIAMEAKPQL